MIHNVEHDPNPPAKQNKREQSAPLYWTKVLQWPYAQYGLSDDVILGYKTEVTAVEAVVRVVTHEEIKPLWNFDLNTLSCPSDVLAQIDASVDLQKCPIERDT
jgi:hypothetical protein